MAGLREWQFGGKKWSASIADTGDACVQELSHHDGAIECL
jgi:hypothetical protein